MRRHQHRNLHLHADMRSELHLPKLGRVCRVRQQCARRRRAVRRLGPKRMHKLADLQRELRLPDRVAGCGLRQRRERRQRGMRRGGRKLPRKLYLQRIVRMRRLRTRALPARQRSRQTPTLRLQGSPATSASPHASTNSTYLSLSFNQVSYGCCCLGPVNAWKVEHACTDCPGANPICPAAAQVC